MDETKAVKLTQSQEALKKDIIAKVNRHFGKRMEEATPQMVYASCAMTVRDRIMEKWIESHSKVRQSGEKKLYYLSFEFLMGRLLSTNILNLMQTQDYKAVLGDLGYSLDEVAELENDAGLGNGGLGRLAACFIDSLTTLDLPAYGCTLRYEYGLFRQKIVDGFQTELPDTWLEHGNAWEVARPEETVSVSFGGKVKTRWENGKMKVEYEDALTVLAVPYDVPLCGYNSSVINKLRLWDAQSASGFNMKVFNAGQYSRAIEEKELASVISKVLYPEDNHTEGKELRLKQQYFLVSATLQWIIKEFESRNGDNYSKMPEKIVIHINDTHPAMAIPELMRILMDEKGLGWDEAWGIVTKVFAYTNHTVMSEALEKWPQDMFRRVVPRLYMILDEMNKRLLKRVEAFYPGDTKKHEYMEIISKGQVAMANLCLAGTFAVNGVSKLHTDILESDIFRDYYLMDKSKFHAITNGITFRRWIAHCNPELTALIDDTIGEGWLTESENLSRLTRFAKDEKFQKKFDNIKRQNKIALAKYIKDHNGIEINPESIYDVQCKRLHEYKRQMMNVLNILAQYNRLLKEPDYMAAFYPKTYIFGAKAAPGYKRAKLIIKLINSVGDMINNDRRIKDKIKVVFIENYGVSIAEKIVTAADVSEQISTAGKEASGTGNMKFMLNGAVTVGTMDGANVEMYERVGKDNIYIFGLRADEVAAKARVQNNDEVKRIYATNGHLRGAMEQLINGKIVTGNTSIFVDLYNTLLFGDYNQADVYMVIRDFEDYMGIQEQISIDYADRKKWIEKQIINTAMAGYFSSDRTIKEYNEKIWHLKPVK